MDNVLRTMLIVMSKSPFTVGPILSNVSVRPARVGDRQQWVDVALLITSHCFIFVVVGESF